MFVINSKHRVSHRFWTFDSGKAQDEKLYTDLGSSRSLPNASAVQNIIKLYKYLGWNT